MKHFLNIGMIASAAFSAVIALAPHPVHAIVLVDQGITYALEMGALTNGGLTQQFALVITGENSITDPLGGRTGINGFALNDTPNGTSVSGTMEKVLINNALVPSPNTNYVFTPGGLSNSGGGGCNSTGNFFCFDNPLIPPIPLTPLITGPVVFVFDVTLGAGGSWANYATSQPHLKIDWVGPNQNNYSLVSKEIGVSTSCPDCVINPVIVDAPEPASMLLLGLGLAGLGIIRRRV